MEHIVQRAEDGHWLTDGEGYFTKVVYLGDGSTPWQECTDAEKEAWEAEHEEKE